MAIVIEEERYRANPLTLVGWGVIFVVIIVAVYFIFFKDPESILTTDVPPEFRNTQAISNLTLNKDTILNNPSFRTRTKPLKMPAPDAMGRANPFIPY